MTEGNAINWNALFVEYSKPMWNSLFRFCLTLSKDKPSAEDLHQTALLKSLTAFSKFISSYSSNLQTHHDVDLLFLQPDIRYHFKNWLYKIIKNTFLDQKESQKKWNYVDDAQKLSKVATYSSPFDEAASLQGHNPSLLKKEEALFYQNALDDDWRKKFQLLNEKQRSIFFLIAEDYSYKEISSILDIPLGTIMSSLSRALEKLKKQK